MDTKSFPSWFLATALILIALLAIYMLATGTGIQFGKGVLRFVPAIEEPAKVAELRSRINDQIKYRAHLDREIKNLRERLTRRVADLSDTAARLAEALRINDERSAEIAGLQQKLRDRERTEDELTTLRSSLKQKDAVLAQLQAENKEILSNITELRGKLNDEKRARTRQEMELNRLRGGSTAR